MKGTVRTYHVDCECGYSIVFYGDVEDKETGELRPPTELIDWHDKMEVKHGWRPRLRVAASTVTVATCPDCGREHMAPIAETLDVDRGGLFGPELPKGGD